MCPRAAKPGEIASVLIRMRARKLSLPFNDNCFHALFTKMTGLFSSDLWLCGTQGDTVLITLNAVCKTSHRDRWSGEGRGHKLRVIVSLLLQTQQLFAEV